MLFAALASAVERHLGEFIAQDLTNIARAFGTASQSDAAIFAALATATELRVGKFSAQELADTSSDFELSAFKI